MVMLDRAAGTAGRRAAADQSGGGIYNNNSTATLTNVTLSGNSAHIGGGIGNIDGTATLTNVTLSGNSVDAAFGSSGSGIWHSGAAGKTITLKNTVVANSPSGGNCFKDGGSVTSITSSGFNLSSDNSCAFSQASDQNNKPAQLGPLANNGGLTLTHLPLPPIVNGIGPIDNGSCVVSTDQRGVSRPQGAACDIGAVEYVTRMSQTITFGPLANKTFGDSPFAVLATASSGLAVTFTAAGQCSVAASTVTLTGLGICTITAHQVGDIYYQPTSDVAQSFTISATLLLPLIVR